MGTVEQGFMMRWMSENMEVGRIVMTIFLPSLLVVRPKSVFAISYYIFSESLDNTTGIAGTEYRPRKYVQIK